MCVYLYIHKHAQYTHIYSETFILDVINRLARHHYGAFGSGLLKHSVSFTHRSFCFISPRYRATGSYVSNERYSPEVAYVVEAAGPVCGANHFEAEGRSEVPDLQQHERQILNEQQRVHQRDGVSHDAPVVTLSGLQHPDAVEEPVRGHEEEDQRH